MSKVFSIMLICLLMVAGSAAAGERNNTASYNRLADKFNHAQPAYEQEEENNQIADRYFKLMADDSFVYYMDKKSAKWILCPNSRDEYIVDVWIRLEPIADGADTKYSYPAKYYLEHYYLRPDKEQIQFLCELEVTGRPDNNVNQRSYDENNWENLVPESIEDVIYQNVVKKMKKRNADFWNIPVGDIMEDWFRISI